MKYDEKDKLIDELMEKNLLLRIEIALLHNELNEANEIVKKYYDREQEEYLKC